MHRWVCGGISYLVPIRSLYWPHLIGVNPPSYPSLVLSKNASDILLPSSPPLFGSKARGATAYHTPPTIHEVAHFAGSLSVQRLLANNQSTEAIEGGRMEFATGGCELGPEVRGRRGGV